MTIVISKYNEDISWVDHIEKSNNIVIIDKLHKEENIGRESHSYLKYIVDNYDSLSGQYVFCQGCPFDHCHDFLTKINLGSPLDYFEFGDKQLTNDICGRPNHFYPLPGVEIWNSLFPEVAVPKSVTFYCGAQFLVTADIIKNRPKSFYEHCIDIHRLIPEAPWVFERIWNRIFSSKLDISKIYYTVGMAVGDSLIAISNIISISKDKKFGVICIPNPNCFSRNDFDLLIKNVNTSDLIYINPIAYYVLIYRFLAYAKMAPGAWESLVRELSYYSGIPVKNIWPTFPRIDYPLSINKFSIQSNIEVPFSKFILFNPLSYNSSNNKEHNQLWSSVLYELCKSTIPVVVVSKNYINTDFANCYNITGKTESVLDDMFLASKSLFTVTTGNNLSIFCNYNNIPHILLAQKNISRGGHAEFFRKWMIQDKLRIVEYTDSLDYFRYCLMDLLDKNNFVDIFHNQCKLSDMYD